LTFVLEQLEAVSPSPRSMFGGVGLYAGDLFPRRSRATRVSED
jgi:TfoX/Sxy family transcriptional regulator of competence genes